MVQLREKKFVIVDGKVARTRKKAATMTELGESLC